MDPIAPIRRYVVERRQEVGVSATSAIDAARIAETAFNSDGVNFKHGLDDVWGNITDNIRTHDIIIREVS